MYLPNWLSLQLQILWRVALFILAFAIVSALVIIPFAPKLSEWGDQYPVRTQLYYDIAGAMAILLATWIMTRFVDRRPFKTIGFTFDRIVQIFLIGLAIGIGWLLMSIGCAWVAGWASLQAPVAFSGLLLLGTAVSVFFNILTQQLLLCGYIFQTIRSRGGFLAALLISAVLFSIYHGGAFQGAWLPAINVFAAGTLFCLAYGATGNLWLPIAIHFAWNFLPGPVLGLTVSGTGKMGLGWKVFEVDGPALFTGGSFGLEGGLIVTLSTASCIIVMILVRSGRLAKD